MPTTEGPVRVLLISGSLRDDSVNTWTLRTLETLALPGVLASRYLGLADVPHFNPDLDGDRLPDQVRRWREVLHAADAVLFCIPEYAGAMPGSFKNLLDWSVADHDPRSLYEKPVAWINVAPEGRALHAHDSLRTVLGYLHAQLVEAAVAAVPVPREARDESGLILDPVIRDALRNSLAALVDAARARRRGSA